jgi:hypothetical protein
LNPELARGFGKRVRLVGENGLGSVFDIASGRGRSLSRRRRRRVD